MVKIYVRRLKAVLVGDVHVGKRVLARRCGGGEGPVPGEFYSPLDSRLVIDTRISSISPWATTASTIVNLLKKMVGKEELLDVKLSLSVLYSSCDEPGLMNLVLVDAHVIGICYNIAGKDSLELAVHKWYPKVRHHRPDVTVVLIGCQSDLRNPEDTSQVTPEDGERASRQIGAVHWMECTATQKESADKVSQSLTYYGWHHYWNSLGYT